MTFEELLKVLRNSEIHEKVKFTHDGMAGYYYKSHLGEFIYNSNGKDVTEGASFFLSDFDRDDWEVLP